MIETHHPENVKGSWFVNDECIGCRLCSEVAPEIFQEATDMSQHVVNHQPENEEELSLAREAAKECPVEAIGSAA